MSLKIPIPSNSAAAHRMGRAVGGAGGLVFSVIWLGMSGTFAGIGVKAAWQSWQQSSWNKVPCVVEEFRILDDEKQDEPFSAKVTFRYETAGRPQVGHHLYPAKPPAGERPQTAEAENPGEPAAKEKRFRDHHKLAALQHQFLGSPTATCLVDPADPNNAALVADREALWGSLAFGLFGLCFVSIGVGILVGSLRTMFGKGSATPGAVTERARHAEKFPRLIGLPFFGLFATAGFGMLWFLTVPMLHGLISGRSWEPTPATVVWSRVRSSSDSDGTTHRPDIFYRYEFAGKTYKSNRDGFFSMSSSGRSAKESLVRDHPKGKSITCFVNPAKPWESVRDRSVGWSALFGLFPLPFLAVGVGGLWYVLRGKRPAKERPITASASAGRSSNSLPESPARQAADNSGPLHLMPGKGRLARVFGTLFVACFWNGIVSVFLFHVAHEWKSGHAPWLLTLFLTPFVAVGTGILVALLANIGALFNPRPRVVLAAAPRLGQTLPVSWEIPSGTGRLQDFRLVLTGEEVATYRRGTNTVTERATFHEATVFETTLPEMMTSGRAGIRLPDNLMPSWQAANNRIEWTLHIKGAIRFWPDLADSHILTVLPPAR